MYYFDEFYENITLNTYEKKSVYLFLIHIYNKLRY